MEINRNQYFLAGLVILLLGIQLRIVDGFVLNERASEFVQRRFASMNSPQLASAGEAATLLASTPLSPRHRLEPPNWIGWSCISLGSVLVFYSLALRKPGG
jgi:hypothetical protein